jgi:hypothetical protein
MTMLVCWLWFPLALALLALGCGLLLEAAAGTRLPTVLLVPAGLAVIVIVSQFAVVSDATAELATPVCVALAVAGLGLFAPGREWRLDPWAMAVGVGAFAAFAAPVLLSGHATFAGYLKLDDTATWFAQLDRLMVHGRNLDGLPPSSYEATLGAYIGNGYPVGAFLPLGVARPLAGQDVAWLFQPYLALLGSVLALSLYGVLAEAVRPAWLRALGAFLAAQAALLFGYALWGGVKEVAAAWLVALGAALVGPMLRGPGSRYSLLPLAFAGAAILSVLSYGGLVWLGPLFVLAVVATVMVRGNDQAFDGAALYFAVVAALALPVLVTAGSFLSSSTVLTTPEELGTLPRSLSGLQLFGIWPATDFRLDPDLRGITDLLIAVAFAAGAAGIWVAWQRRAWSVLAYAGAALIGLGIAVAVGSPWVDAKALATASPLFIALAFVGASALLDGPWRPLVAVVAVALAAGVVWSNALAYKGANLAPRDRLAELEKIGKRFDGQGPALLNEYELYGVKHFLRGLDPEAPSSTRRRRLIPLRNGRVLAKEDFADVEDFLFSAVLNYRTLVLRRSASASRPSSLYKLRWRGRFYEVWQRPTILSPPVLEHVALGNVADPVATPPCQELSRIARVAGPGGRVAAVVRPSPVRFQLSRARHPDNWATEPQDLDLLRPFGAGTAEARVTVPAAGLYGAWLGGSFKSGLALEIDGKRLAARRNQLNHRGNYVPLGEATLSRGAHTVTIHYDGADLHPGSGGQPYRIGPLVLGRGTAERPVTYVRPADARSLCGKQLDWLEAVGRPSRVPRTAGSLNPLSRPSRSLFGRQLRRR